MTGTNRWLPPEAFTKSARSADTAFYQQPLLVNHIDEAAITALSTFYGVNGTLNLTRVYRLWHIETDPPAHAASFP
jgi:hypothetical protein